MLFKVPLPPCLGLQVILKVKGSGKQARCTSRLRSQGWSCCSEQSPLTQSPCVLSCSRCGLSNHIPGRSSPSQHIAGIHKLWPGALSATAQLSAAALQQAPGASLLSPSAQTSSTPPSRLWVSRILGLPLGLLERSSPALQLGSQASPRLGPTSLPLSVYVSGTRTGVPSQMHTWPEPVLWGS